MSTAAAVTPYLRVTNERVRDSNLPPGPRTLYLVLCSYAWRSPRIAISQSKLAQDCRVVTRTIRRWTKQLEEAGYVKVYEKPGCISHYELCVDWKPAEKRDPGSVVRTGAEQVRIDDPHQARDRGSVVPDQLPLPEKQLSGTTQKKEFGPADPFARWRNAPGVLNRRR